LSIVQTNNASGGQKVLPLIGCVALFGATFGMYQAVGRPQTFSPSKYQEGSKTAGIQEAIDAAAKTGGGTVEIPAGTFVLHADSGKPPILLKSRVNLHGAGQEKTILKLEPNSKNAPAVVANQNYANPDAAEPDHDITLEAFTIDGAAADQVLRETKLSRAIPAGGEQEVVLESMEGIRVDSVLRIEPGPNEEIVPIIRAAGSSYHALLLRPHPAGARVVELVERLHGLGLAGARNVSIQNVTIQNANMDGIYLSSTLDSTQHRTYSRKIDIQKSKFLACHRNGISVIDADDVTIANNQFQDITGDPGAPVDVEPDYPEQHGNRISIRDNTAYKCYRGIFLALRLGGSKSENFQGESITGNNIVGVLFDMGIAVLSQQAGAVVSGNTITDPAGDGIIVAGSSHVQATNNAITNPGHCHVLGTCRNTAAGIRLIDDNRNSLVVSGNLVTGNNIKDTQRPPTMLYGIEFSSTGMGNTIEKNVISGFDAARGMSIHVGGKADSNKISAGPN
jgi:parallel beta helix pectate lyase-like protein/pectate lyase-like protein